MSLAVEAEGHEARVARDLSEFVHLLGLQRPDVILTEGSFPGAPVDQVCRYLRQRAALREGIPIIMFSDADGMALETLARNAGADRWLCKARGLEELVAELRALLDEILF
jgi:DNA-binding response OmpR family regulator